MNKKRVQERNLEILARNNAFQFTPTFKLYTSGKIGPYSIQSGVVQGNGKDYSKACKDMVDYFIDFIKFQNKDMLNDLRSKK